MEERFEAFQAYSACLSPFETQLKVKTVDRMITRDEREYAERIAAIRKGCAVRVLDGLPKQRAATCSCKRQRGTLLETQAGPQNPPGPK